MTTFLNPAGAVQPLKPNEPNINKKSDNISQSKDIVESDDEVFPQQMGDGFATREEVVNAIETAIKNDKNLIIKLTKYAQRKIFGLYGEKNGKLQPEDIVQEAISRILLLKRKWYKNKVPRIENLIIMTIVSLIRIENEKTKERENQLYNPIEAGITKNKNSIKSNFRVIPLFYTDENNSNNDNTVADTEKYKYQGSKKTEDNFDFESLDEEDYIIQLEKELEEDEIAFFVLQARLDGIKSNIEIAKELGIEVKDVENSLKRIVRKIKKVTRKTKT